MTSPSPFDPDYDGPPGLAPFLQRPLTDGDLANVRAAHLLSIATRLLGRTDQVVAMQADSRALGAPIVRRPGRLSRSEAVDTFDDRFEVMDPERLHDITERELQRVDRGLFVPDAAARRQDETALWHEINRSRSRATALALLNLDVRSEVELQAVAAASAIHSLTAGQSADAQTVLEDAIESSDEEAVRIALAALHQPLREPESDDGSTGDDHPEVRESSVCIHGTWARLDADPWYASGSSLHSFIRGKCTPNLFSGRDHFRWTGGYTEQERRDVADDFVPWKRAQSIAQVDTLFAHSHDGNVALNRIAAGERVPLLVLLHTPVTPRTDDEWRTIARNVGRVLVLRTRADLVMMADQFINGSTMDPPSKFLPLRSVKRHWRHPDAWFSHNRFVELATWQRFSLDGDIRHERSLI